MQKLIIEVAQNEDNVTKAENPHVPFTPEEIAADAIACAKAGASIIHFHSKDPATGKNRLDDPDLYIETVRLIRKESDVIVCPSYNARFVGTGSFDEALAYWDKFIYDPEVRPEITGVVPRHEGNYGTHYDPIVKNFDRRKEYITDFLAFLKKRDITPLTWVSETGHLREVIAYKDCGLIDGPLNIKLYMSDTGIYGIKPTPENYVNMAKFMDPAYDWQVMTMVYGPPGSPSKNMLYPLAISMGHHIRTGIGDLNRSGFGLNRRLQGIECEVTNPGLVKELVDYATSIGRGIATPDEARALLGIKPFKAPARAAE